MKFLISFLLLLIVLASGCKKNKTIEQLPPETQEGKFTFGCKVDGFIFEVSGKPGLLSIENVSYYIVLSDTTIHISVRSRRSNKDFNFDFTFKYTEGQGVYSLTGFPETNYLWFSTMKSVIGRGGFRTSLQHKGWINIKYFNGSFFPYTSGTILSGTFEADLVNDEGKVIHITDGRFDIGK